MLSASTATRWRLQCAYCRRVAVIDAPYSSARLNGTSMLGAYWSARSLNFPAPDISSPATLFGAPQVVGFFSLWNTGAGYTVANTGTRWGYQPG